MRAFMTVVVFVMTLSLSAGEELNPRPFVFGLSIGRALRFLNEQPLPPEADTPTSYVS